MRAAALLMLALIAGCAAPAVEQARTATATAAATGGADARFRAERPALRRVGYRNCDGYSMQLLVPRQVGAGDPRSQSIWWEILVYQPGRHASFRVTVPEDVDNPGWQTWRRTGDGWQPLARQTAAQGRDRARQVTLSAAGLGRSLPVRLGLTDAIGLALEQMVPGSYRVQSAPFSVAVPGGQNCSMRPFWVFDIR